ncbi:TolC family outer membrane protein [Aestuariispira insulae]|uniref:TolC family outer membrane protein n=1 Tax=Aestuariispira insulae TaxID=1461337 RepID=UPI0015F25E6D|nr:TolC family outer membrane protein [Aestuariispira insulae]
MSAILPTLVSNHNLIEAARSDLSAAQERYQVARGGYYPEFETTSNWGHEYQTKPADDNTSLAFSEADFSITQRLYDFGATDATIDAAKLTVRQYEAQLTSTEQTLLLRGLTAYTNVARAKEAIGYAERAENNIKKQAELEDIRVQKGGGYSSDVLQAKTQLAGAQARLVAAQGTLKVARNSFKGVFGRFPENEADMSRPALPLHLIPANVEDAVAIALDNNPQLTAAQLSADIADETRKNAEASGFRPTIDVVADVKYKKNVSGTVGFKREALGKVEINFPFNLGLTAINTLKAAEQDHTSVLRRFRDARDQVEEQVRNSWAQLEVARLNSELLRSQAELAEAFLDQARRERELGQRSLLEVTQAETNLLNASSDAASAEADVAIAGFSLLNAMGQLSLDAALNQ